MHSSKNHIYYGTIHSRADLQAIITLHPEAEVHFAFGQNRFRHNYNVEAFSAFYSWNQRIFGVAGHRFLQNGEATSWTTEEREIKNLEGVRATNKRHAKKEGWSLDMQKVFNDVLDRLTLLQQSWEEGKEEEESGEQLPFRGKVVLPSVGIGNEERN